MVENYQERKQAKLERFQELALKANRESQEAYDGSSRIADAIPFGQPILVGHHSEKRHRRDLQRMGNLMDKSIELSKKSEYYENRVEAMQSDDKISSDDPEAVKKLEEKLKLLEEKREKYKEHNKQARKEGKEALPAYALQNLSGNIKSVRDRIEYLKKLQNKETKEIEINGIRILNNVQDNRTQIFFPSIPPEEVRDKLKRNGFRWSPYNKCWQRFLNDWAFRIAEDIAKGEV